MNLQQEPVLEAVPFETHFYGFGQLELPYV